MANGLMGFPQFAPGGEGGLIPTIQMPQTRMSFPTPRGGGGSRAKVPAAAYLAPYLVSGGLGALLDRQQPTVEEQKAEGYYERYPEGKTRDAAILADQLYGVDPKQEKGFKGFLKRSAPVLADVLAGAAFGEEGGAQYGATATNIRQAKNLAERNRLADKQAFIAAKLDPGSAQDLTMVDMDKLKVGVVDPRAAYFDPKERVSYVFDPKHKEANDRGYVSTKKQGGNWVDFTAVDTEGRDLADFFKDPTYKALLETEKEQMAKDLALLNTHDSINEAIELLDEGIKDPRKNPASAVTSFMKLGDDLMVNVDQLITLKGTRDVADYFSQDETGGGEGREGSGILSQGLWLAIQSGNEESIEEATKAWEQGTGESLRDLMGEAAYANVALRSVMLTLGYAAAASGGQTGRTLSDKDLAFFLNIVGFEATQNPAVMKANLLRFGDRAQRQADNSVLVYLPKQTMGKFNMGIPQTQSIIGNYYEPPTNEQGNQDWLNYTGYSFKNFGRRYKDHPGYTTFKSHQRGYGAPPSDKEKKKGIFDGLDVPLNLEDI